MLSLEKKNVFLQRTKDRRQKNNCDAKGERKEMFPTFAMIQAKLPLIKEAK